MANASKKPRQEPTKKRGLTAKQKAFVQEYLIDLNAVQSALRAGYSQAKAKNASEFLKIPLVKEAVDKAQEKRSKRTELTQDRVIQELANIAFADLRDVAEWSGDSLTLKASHTLTPEQASMISDLSVTATATGNNVKVKRHDKVKALELIMRHMGMLNDKSAIDLTSSDGSMTPKQPLIIDMSNTTLEDIIVLSKNKDGEK